MCNFKFRKMKVTCVTILLMISLFVGGCKKPKPVVFYGQLLLTKKSLMPLSNRRIEIFQLGGNAIIMGSSGSSAAAVTDANGRFSITFVPGDSYFGPFRGESNSPLTLFGAINDSLSFMRRNFPDSNYDASKPIFVGKTIDSVIIKVNCFKNIFTSDTFALRGITFTGRFNKNYTGLMVDSATSFTLDTIYHVLFTDFESSKGRFANNNIEFGRLKTYPGGTTPSFSSQSPWSMELSADDEPKREMTFTFSQ